MGTPLRWAGRREHFAAGYGRQRMSEQIPITEARERLNTRLWAGECAIDGNGRLSVAAHRLWCALREQRFPAEEEGRQLSAHDLTEVLRRKLFSTAGLTVDADRFTAWIAGVVPLTSPPSTPYMTAVEAALFLTRGAFLTTDDFTAIAEAQIKIAGPVQIIGVSVNTSWESAERQLFTAHVDDKLTLIGRRAPFFGADPAGETAPVPKEFFAGSATLRLGNIIRDREDAMRPVYCDVKLLTTEFSSAFLVPNEPAAPAGGRERPARRQPTKIDEREFLLMARGLHTNRGFGPSLIEAVELARQRRLNRDWARSQIAKLPDELRRPRGGRGSTRHLAKPRAAE
jgi:hypothetical protein